jgi:Putative methyltransferase
MTDWNHWLRRYDKPRSPHSQRLATVQRLIGNRIDRTAPDPISVLSICAGDGRDILEVLSARADASRVRATLVELDPRLCALARSRVSESRISGISIKQADAGITDSYAGVARADLAILVGVFGNIADADVHETVRVLPGLCKPGALVIWSLRQQPRRDQGVDGTPRQQAGPPRRNDYDRVEKVREWLNESGFSETFVNREDAVFHVSASRYDGGPVALPVGHRFFNFDSPRE